MHNYGIEHFIEEWKLDVSSLGELQECFICCDSTEEGSDQEWVCMHAQKNHAYAHRACAREMVSREIPLFSTDLCVKCPICRQKIYPTEETRAKICAERYGGECNIGLVMEFYQEMLRVDPAMRKFAVQKFFIFIVVAFSSYSLLPVIVWLYLITYRTLSSFLMNLVILALGSFYLASFCMYFSLAVAVGILIANAVGMVAICAYLDFHARKRFFYASPLNLDIGGPWVLEMVTFFSMAVNYFLPYFWFLLLKLAIVLSMLFLTYYYRSSDINAMAVVNRQDIVPVKIIGMDMFGFHRNPDGSYMSAIPNSVFANAIVVPRFYSMFREEARPGEHRQGGGS